LLEIFVKDTSY